MNAKTQTNWKFNLLTIGFLLVAGLTLAGCDSDSSNAASATMCPEPRPQGPVACTLQFDPVCGQLSGGVSREYDNSCAACADPAVVSYTRGSCSPQ